MRARCKVLDNDGWALSLQTLHNDGPVSDPFLVITAQCRFNICTYHENTSECIRETDLAACAFPFHYVKVIPASSKIQVALGSLSLAKRRSISRHAVDILVRNMIRAAGPNTAFLSDPSAGKVGRVERR